MILHPSYCLHPVDDKAGWPPLASTGGKGPTMIDYNKLSIAQKKSC